MRLEKFCPKCGRKIELGYGPKFLCRECILKEVKIPKIEITKCVKCGKPVGSQTIEEKCMRVLGKIGEVLSIKLENNLVIFKLREKNSGTYFFGKRKLELKHTVCKECSRKACKYYTCIAQLRGNEEAFHLLIKAMRELENRNAFIAKILRVKGREGQKALDLYLSSSSLLYKALKILKGEFEYEKKVTRKLVTRKDRRIFRVTVLLRFS